MLQMSQYYEPEFKKKIVRLQLEKLIIINFTYLFLTDGSKRYNCTIIDLYDRSVIASITDENLDITQSMSKAEYPYDNAPMERYFNTLKNKL